MQAKQFKDEYPIHTLTLLKSETSRQDVDAIIATLKSKVDAHPVAIYIAIFDHYSHTSTLKEGKISTEILDAKELICCFGKELMDPEMLAVRPRAIGVAERQDDFVISFIKAPNPLANESMISWVKDLADIAR